DGTIENIANILRSSKNILPLSPLVTIQGQGSKSPFFCVHPGGGNVFCYLDLASQLGSDQPFYGLQAKGLNSDQEEPKTLNTIQDMAEYYIAAIKKNRPYGPYYLGGWCTGGVVAFEMARQLQQQGDEVALLVLIESYLPVPIQHINLDEKRALLEQILRIQIPSQEYLDDTTLVTLLFAWDLGSLFGKEIPISIQELQQNAPNKQLKYILKKTKALDILPTEFNFKEITKLWNVFKANLQAMYSYIPQSYSGKTVIFHAYEELRELSIYPIIDWNQVLVGDIDKYQISGDHYSIMRNPDVEILATKLKEYLKQ
ncbi:MAG: thioesterase domain-containing protein, partial [Xenococcus sp. (in: cyanobacteria)]